MRVKTARPQLTKYGKTERRRAKKIVGLGLLQATSNFSARSSESGQKAGKPFPFRSPEGRVALVVEVEKARYTKLPFQHTPPE